MILLCGSSRTKVFISLFSLLFKNFTMLTSAKVGAVTVGGRKQAYWFILAGFRRGTILKCSVMITLYLQFCAVCYFVNPSYSTGGCWSKREIYNSVFRKTPSHLASHFIPGLHDVRVGFPEVCPWALPSQWCPLSSRKPRQAFCIGHWESFIFPSLFVLCSPVVIISCR